MNSYYPYIYKYLRSLGVTTSIPSNDYEYSAYGGFNSYNSFVGYTNYSQPQAQQEQSQDKDATQKE